MKKVCVVGFGAIGPIHTEAIIKAKNAELYAVCDIDPVKNNAAREKYRVKTYTDFDEMLADSQVDSVHICTPHYLHFDMMKKAILAGKSVVCEKPATMTKAEFDELCSLDGADKICFVLQNRLNPCALKFREIAESGGMGKVISAKGILTWKRTKEYYDSGEWRGKWDTEGGGVLINQAVHTLDFFSYIAGGVRSVKAQMMNFSLDSIEVEDTFASRLILSDGATGVFFATNAYGGNSAPEFEVIFEKGIVRYAQGKLFVDGAIIREDVLSTGGKAYWGTGHERLIANYYDENKYFSILDVKNTMDTLFAMYESARENGKEIIL